MFDMSMTGNLEEHAEPLCKTPASAQTAVGAG